LNLAPLQSLASCALSGAGQWTRVDDRRTSLLVSVVVMKSTGLRGCSCVYESDDCFSQQTCRSKHGSVRRIIAVTARS